MERAMNSSLQFEFSQMVFLLCRVAGAGRRKFPRTGKGHSERFVNRLLGGRKIRGRGEESDLQQKGTIIARRSTKQTGEHNHPQGTFVQETIILLT
jgi:hypothetical protein